MAAGSIIRSMDRLPSLEALKQQPALRQSNSKKGRMTKPLGYPVMRYGSIEEAVAAERERCAKIAETTGLSFIGAHIPTLDLHNIQRQIAAIIRQQ